MNDTLPLLLALVALVEAIALLVSTRAHRRERDRLLDRIMARDYAQFKSLREGAVTPEQAAGFLPPFSDEQEAEIERRGKAAIVVDLAAIEAEKRP